MNITFGDNAKIVSSPIGANEVVYNFTNNSSGSTTALQQESSYGYSSSTQARSSKTEKETDDYNTTGKALQKRPTGDEDASDVTSVSTLDSDGSGGLPIAQLPQVMISYNWGSYKIVKKIYKGLGKAGFKVWIDRKSMGGEIYDSMANAVNESDVFMPCLSKAYEQSINCMSEAKYAAKNNKLIVPILVENGYNPSGALDFIIAGKLYINFCSGNFDDRMSELKKRLVPKTSSHKISQQTVVRSSVCVIS